MAKRVKPKIQLGDRFIKVGEAHGRIWEVVDLRVTVDGILHAQLRATGRDGGAMTIAAGVLMDTDFWRAALNGSGLSRGNSAGRRDESE
ncbi:hypothetical protein [Paramagnetospirillum marisnigri]|uniref:hypothetical protein n=1 Tax=Paramagnetospirillum marisnigri TaxID=1285242 RepID=UPI0012E85E6D|nr:hypothetical protein [Paramagnetospirillum marisnigri]